MAVRFPKEMSPLEFEDLETLFRQEGASNCVQIIKLYSKYMEDSRKLREKLSDDIDKLFNHWPKPPKDPDESS